MRACVPEAGLESSYNYTPQYMWDVITSPCSWYLFVACKSTALHLMRDNRTKSREVLNMRVMCEGIRSLYNLTGISVAVLPVSCWRGYEVPLNTWRINNVVITSKRRHFDVITSKWRRFDVITTLLLRNVFAGVWQPITQFRDVTASSNGASQHLVNDGTHV